MARGAPATAPAARRGRWLVAVGSSIGEMTTAAVDPELAARTVASALVRRKATTAPAQAGPDDREAA